MKECLNICHKLNVTSISFPALGTGVIGVQRDKAAEIMLHEVLTFAKETLRKLTVKFVIFPLDKDMYQVC